MLGVFAEFETALRRERQMEGVAAAKAKGVYRGGVQRIDHEEVRRMRAAGMGATSIAAQMKISRRAVYNICAKPA